MMSESSQTELKMSARNVVALSLLSFACATAGAEDARERSFIGKGMKEGEVLFRIGKPDHEAIVRSAKGHEEEKTWTYFPHARDPQTMTVITLRAGVVEDIDRKIAR
jgi:hypothetical protein